MRLKLVIDLTRKREQLRRCENSIGKAHNIRRMVRLREQIADIERKLERKT